MVDVTSGFLKEPHGKSGSIPLFPLVLLMLSDAWMMNNYTHGVSDH